MKKSKNEKPRNKYASQEKLMAAVAPAPITYKVRNAFPPDDVSVKVIFRGLLNLYFDDTRPCTVGVFNASPAFPPHILEFRRWTRNAEGICPLEPTKIYDKPVTKFKLKVNNPIDSMDGIYVFGGKTFDRTAVSGNEVMDYRWILDFEVDIYGHELKSIPAKIGPRLTIDNGLFYTYHKTTTKFIGRHVATGANVKQLTSLAEVMAANIYLKPGGSVQVFIDDNPDPVDTLKQEEGQHQIDVYNLCRTCVFDPLHPTDRTRRNDLHLYYRALDLTSTSDTEFEFLTLSPKNSKIIDLCELAPHTTDPAPCGPSGYGRTPKG